MISRDAGISCREAGAGCVTNIEATIGDILAVGPGVSLYAGVARSFALDDVGQYIRATNAAAVALTVPANADVAFQVGAVLTVEQAGAGQVTIGAAGGVTVNAAGNKMASAAQYSVLSLVKVDTNVWTLFGDRA